MRPPRPWVLLFLGAALLVSCEFIFDPDKIQVPNGGTDGGGADVGVWWLPDAGANGLWCSTPMAGCSDICLQDQTGTFGGMASVAAMAGPAAQYSETALALAYGSDVWVGYVTGAGIATLTSHFAASGTVTSLAVADGHELSATGQPCTEALYAINASSATLVASGPSDGGCWAPSPFNVPLVSPLAMGWLKSSSDAGVLGDALALVGGVSAYLLAEHTLPSSPVGTPVTLPNAVNGISGAPAFDEWGIAGPDANAPNPNDLDLYFKDLSAATNNYPISTLPAVVTQASYGAPVSAYFYTNPSLGLELAAPDATMTVNYGDTSQPLPAGTTQAQMYTVRWSTTGTTDTFRTALLTDGGVAYVQWQLSNPSPPTYVTQATSTCVPPGATWAFPAPPNFLVSLHPGGHVALSALP